MLSRPALAVTVLGLLVAAPAAAEIQKSGPQVFTGKFQVGLHPAGAQIKFGGSNVGGYKFTADFAGKVKDYEKITLWVGGGLNYTFGTYGGSIIASAKDHDIQLWAFVMITLEKLMKIPLVPFVRGGIGGDILLYDRFTSGILSGGAFAVRLGGGIHYYIIKQLGLGFETNFTVGPGFYPQATIPGGCGGPNTCTAFYGSWDFGFGARGAF